jgi:hypothetical protein
LSFAGDALNIFFNLGVQCHLWAFSNFLEELFWWLAQYILEHMQHLYMLVWFIKMFFDVIWVG